MGYYNARVGLPARLSALLLSAAWIAVLAGAAIAISGGVEFHAGPALVRAHNPLPAFAIAVVCAGATVLGGTAAARAGLVYVWDVLPRMATGLALAAAVAAALAGVQWGTSAAGGTDSSCYLHQAEMIARGELREPLQLAGNAPWPNATSTLVPIAFVESPAKPGAVVPACPSGFPLIMAAARAIGGRPAMFWVVPLLAGCAVWCTFLFGRRIAGDREAVLAAVILAASPTFLYQAVQPMSDVPALAAWTAALAAGLRAPGSTPWAGLTGALAGAALLIRPNMLPLVAPLALACLLIRPDGWPGAWRRVIAIGAGLVPFVGGIAWLNVQMYGGAFSSGYGRLRDLMTLEHVAGNLRTYPLWLIETQTPFILIGLAAPLVERDPARRRFLWLALSFAALTAACYLPYTVWDAWWFLRFLLPAFPPLIVLAVFAACRGCCRLSPAWRLSALAVLTGSLVLFELLTAADRAAFRLRDLEARYRVSGEYATASLPSNAVFFSENESGSLSYYTGRPIVRWSLLDPAWLDRAVIALQAQGYRPLFVFETNEEPEFRQRFGGVGGLGHLDWPPIANLDRQVRVYEPADRARYLRGEQIDTTFVISRSGSGPASR